MELIKKIFKIAKEKMNILSFGFRCPKCGSWIHDDDDCCETCGYPYND